MPGLEGKLGEPGAMMPGLQGKLREPGVCRIFFSSPFNGMEGEREGLTRRYWPQIQSLCNSRGIQFVPVDMRWGITTELSDDAQTINICLREIDRSDMFVGFFGQRYGWHGEKDEALQKNFDAAVTSYLWLEEERGKSVTELEFLHGHLRQPGRMPAVMCFRDKAWDDIERQKGVEQENKRTIYKYSSESEHATQLMDDLKRRVKDTEDKCLAVHMAYSNPAEGVQLMFEAIWRHLTEVLLRDSQVSLSARQRELAQHDTFCDTRCGLYVQQHDATNTINQFISQASDTPLLILGAPGVGKTALVSNWIREQQKHDPDAFLIYHFSGPIPHSHDIKHILRRLISNTRYLLRKSKGHDLEKDDLDLKDVEVKDLVQKWESITRDITSQGHKIKIILDGLNNIDHGSKVTKPFYWLLKKLPDGVHLVCTTSDNDQTSREELIEARQWQTHTVRSLESDTRGNMCKALLKLRGKELSPHQTEKIIETQQTCNPLYLKILIEELCNFGRFRELDKKIDYMISSKTSKELFEKFLERCEQDYNPPDWPGNMVAQVLSGLAVSRQGLSEKELQDLHDIPSNLWTPLYYGIVQFLINTSGFLKFAHNELIEAVNERYIHNDKQRCDILMKQINFYDTESKRLLSACEKVPDHYYTELPWLCLQAKNKDKLASFITNPAIFDLLLGNNRYELLEYVHFIDWTTDQFIKNFSSKIRWHVASAYTDCLEYLEPPHVIEYLLNALLGLVEFLKFGHYLPEHEHFLLWLKDLLGRTDQLEEGNRRRLLRDVNYNLGCLYAELMDYQKTHDVNLPLIQYYEGLTEKSSDDWSTYGMYCHSMGNACKGLGDLNLAEEYYRKSMAAHEKCDYDGKRIHIGTSLSGIAEVKRHLGQTEDAIKLYEEVIQLEEELYFGSLPPSVAHTLTNLGICYRKVGNFDKAYEVYDRSMKIKQNALGWYHPDVAIGCGNFSNFYRDQSDHTKAIEWLHKAIDIYEHLGQSDTMMATMSKENLLLNIIYLGETEKMTQAENYFWEVFNTLNSRGELHKGLPSVHLEYLRKFMSDKAMDKVRMLTSAYVEVDSLRNPLVYSYIAYIDARFPPEGGAPDRPHEHSLDFCIERYPSVDHLYFSKAEFQLIPQRDAEGLVDTVKLYYKTNDDLSERVVVICADKCDEAGWLEGAMVLYQRALKEILPNNIGILRNLAMLNNKLGHPEKMVECLEQASSLAPDDPSLTNMVIRSCFMTRNTEKLQKYLTILEAARDQADWIPDKLVFYKAGLQELLQAADNSQDSSQPS